MDLLGALGLLALMVYLALAETVNGLLVLFYVLLILLLCGS